MFNRIAALTLAASLALAGARAEAQQVEETTLALPALALVFSPLYIADSAGFWTKHGLRVKLHDITGIGAMNAVLAGSVDFSSSSGPTIIRAFVRGQRTLGIGETLDDLATELVIRKDIAQAAGITEKSPVEKRGQLLRGKKVSLTSPNTIPHAHLRYIARKGGVDPEREITVVSNLAEAGFAALKNNAVEGYHQGPPWSRLAIQQGLAVMLSSPANGDLPELIPLAFNIIVSRLGLCDQKPSVCTKMMAGIGDAMIYMHDHPKESIEHLRKRLPGNQEVFEESFESVRKWTPRSAEVKEEAMANAQKLMLVGGMLREDEKLSSFKEIYTNKYVKK
jgi:ABC-type nitrate/sulfonate/bicarbonate transport system substrate-binding protein